MTDIDLCFACGSHFRCWADVKLCHLHGSAANFRRFGTIYINKKTNMQLGNAQIKAIRSAVQNFYMHLHMQ